MKVIYFDCGMGAAGDMLAAALIELLPNPDEFIAELNGLGIPGVHYKFKKAVKCGISGTQLSVIINGEEENEEMYHNLHGHNHGEEAHSHNHDNEHVHNHNSFNLHHNPENQSHEHHHHTGISKIEHIVEKLPLNAKVRDDVLSVYRLIAESESKVHGVPVTDVHFHEVGTMDAIADIVAVCLLMDRISPDETIVSPVHVGSGQVKCAHGILPVPAPATALILKDIPIYGGRIKGELCTPTGAALLKHFATRFGEMPIMKTTAIGYGMGKKDFETANCVRIMLGETEDSTDTIFELSCNVDDMTAEEIGFAMDRLFEGGARDVFIIPISMKKSRPGTLIQVLCSKDNKDNIISLLFRHTTTLGVREAKMHRYVLERQTKTISTPYGIVRRKDSYGYGTFRSKYEYDDLSRIAKENSISLQEARKLIEDFERKKES